MRDLRQDSTQLYIADQVQTFVDNLILESVTDVTRRWHTPERVGDGPVLTKTEPWEGLPYFVCQTTIIRDPDDGLFKCWYEIMVGEPDKSKMALGMDSYSCVATSEDGLHWEKPALDNLIVDGRKTNVILGSPESGGAHSMTVIRDPYPKSEAERFKGMFTLMWDQNKNRKIVTAYSPDGINWNINDDVLRIGLAGPRLCDGHNLAYDEDAREYVCYTRHFLMTAGATRVRFVRDQTFGRPLEPDNFATYCHRRVWVMRSTDFIHWSEPVLIAAADESEDNLDESYYYMVPYKLGALHLGPVGVFKSVDNEIEVQLLHSRDGLRWQRAMKGQPFLDHRGEGYWDAHLVYINNPPIEVDDKLYFYYSGSNFHHDWWMVGLREGIDHPEAIDPLGCGSAFGVGLATLRKDGYASLYANQYRQGIVITRNLISLGTQLVINARCAKGGSIRVEVQNRLDKVLGECTIDNSDAFTDDSVEHTMTWKGDPTIPAGRGQELYWRKLKFQLRNAELFSFRFTHETDDVSPYKTEKEW